MERAVRTSTPQGMRAATGEIAKSVINGGCGWLQIGEDRVNRLHETSQGLIEAGPPVLPDDYDEFPPHWIADVELSSS